ncbi:hypothetical protein CRG98_040542 [Punica granatum]|uniref:Uncharacterized protein n=1 Tax=Punica granatum TaxID=22663 RepID=A0A2I0I4W7_PUNGR|nr:hypothetical protein CRG98_040542 [Punica granatum]
MAFDSRPSARALLESHLDFPSPPRFSPLAQLSILNSPKRSLPQLNSILVPSSQLTNPSLNLSSPSTHQLSPQLTTLSLSISPADTRSLSLSQWISILPSLNAPSPSTVMILTDQELTTLSERNHHRLLCSSELLLPHVAFGRNFSLDHHLLTSG